MHVMCKMSGCKNLQIFWFISVVVVQVDAYTSNTCKLRFTPEDDIKLELQTQLKQFESAWNEGDFNSLKQMYVKDAIFMGQGFPTAIGRKDILSTFRIMRAALPKLEIVEIIKAVQTSPCHAYHLDKSRLYDQNGTMVIANGRSIDVWIKVNGVWKFENNVLNSF